MDMQAYDLDRSARVGPVSTMVQLRQFDAAVLTAS